MVRSKKPIPPYPAFSTAKVRSVKPTPSYLISSKAKVRSKKPTTPYYYFKTEAQSARRSTPLLLFLYN